ncbi:hypothetical protein C731_4820 [Mycolicibacterium hassiacum DSM 44199]|jgi:hypothetical protein|uniref:Uncharacterized protein n=1 Tax=Mycolicibacterium hassiacum (strain DSM 44199 / CIP 105218 / JCM 12690 / 3849) TaxID=1122247 RepID=K5BIE7_MYCHD|nr:Zn-ribbon domain-containing OB-fold protein [Mycolicibacterium hassiacum]EKF21234.1 hypothetical protein C731_4820 [Mycolicibacterium hassiacum DSM 44199]MBX5486699.1 Zn-ribbon domain-containing OB-fold protein [Mycolicibacterium hassiacum]MDA4085063.1 DNA-binding protein [Mycolicibacterium hassiacum DSM 44199]PZN17430.1 MAG: DNA-binding protein [Mycolicibacterium hassiacum]VCT89022.1 hypothetical protein MHAS_00708 [Mycolicibacterium hassiacum DSM 44199]
MSDETTPTPPSRILPGLTDHNRAFWTGGAQGQLLITRCTGCRRWINPPEPDCPYCGGRLDPQPVSGQGTVFTYTVNHQPFNPAVPVPYVVAIVQLDEQDDLRVAANIVDCEPDSVRIGMRVQVRFERHEVDGTDRYVPVFAPAAA